MLNQPVVCVGGVTRAVPLESLLACYPSTKFPAMLVARVAPAESPRPRIYMYSYPEAMGRAKALLSGCLSSGDTSPPIPRPIGREG